MLPTTFRLTTKFFLLQDDDNALLQQALAMSMDDTSSNVTARDTDMPEAAADDHELQLGKVLKLLAKIIFIFYIFGHHILGIGLLGVTPMSVLMILFSNIQKLHFL